MRLSILVEGNDKILESVGIFIKLPEEIARQYPKMDEDTSPPHITVLFVGDIDHARLSEFIECVQLVASDFKPVEVFIGGLAYFTNDNGEEVAHSMVEAKGLAALNDDLWNHIEKKGFEVGHMYLDYTPHVTLAYSDKRNYVGPVPKGQFLLKELEIWAKDGQKLGVVKLGG